MTLVSCARPHVRRAVVRLAGVVLLGSIGVAPALAVAAPLPPLNSSVPSEDVTVRAVLSARDAVVVRADGTEVRVRMPGVTVPEGDVNGVPVCGAAEATAALTALLPVGAAARLQVAGPGGDASWVKRPELDRDDFRSDEAYDAATAAAVIAADGAVYADLSVPATTARQPQTAAEAMARLGWLRAGVPLEVAQADPTEVGLGPSTFVGREARTALLAQRGVHARCGGSFHAPQGAPPQPVPTRWGVTNWGWVKTIGGVSVHQDTKRREKRDGHTVTVTHFGRPGFERFVAAWGPGTVTLVAGACIVDWPERGLRITSDTIESGGRLSSPLAAPRTAEACFELPIRRYEAHGPAALLGTLPTRSAIASVRKKVGRVGRSRYDRSVGFTAGNDDNDQYVGALELELDRRSRLAGLVLQLGFPMPAL